MLATSPPVRAQSIADWTPHIVEASRRFGVPVSWIERVMQAETGGRRTLNGRPIVSWTGAMGLMQLMPGTWETIRATLNLGRDPFDPRDNIFAGTFYLRKMYERFGHPGLFAAYNAGPARYVAFLSGRRGLPAETRTYLAKVAGGPLSAPALLSAQSPVTTFATATAVAAPLPSPVEPASGSNLFAIRVP
ncbi:lytic transglycosylase domain-containing protein [Sphingomonas sp. BIUV-7]|uniref:Lytic transglycosylase domain-containing protein n=1 Tax=Sphingomonas natans TaxID=3063330 RepID=A0ABT8YF05_9SPHN|nr:lytic transglycosylase domain-containing protein [Sphingomonas sp. BIUV-7]MDO6416249.1 lytic transglycosylase domain-containing protein [Sphingomonas sp. BIUV-7]